MVCPLVLVLIVSRVLGHSIDHSIAQQYQTLQDCLISKGVPTTLNSSSDWNSLTTAYNLRLQYTPVAVTIPTTPEHVSDSITCAAASGIKVQPRSGGHSYGSYSLGGKNGSLVVDLQKFNEITLDKSTNIIKVGSGVRLGNLGLAVFNQGHAALPHGTFPGVGIGGHYTHGGFGYSSRKWGLALDTILAMDVVLSNGTQIHTSRTSHADMFFALRGAADSFGIITTFYLQTSPAPVSVTSYVATFSSQLNASSAASSILLQLQSFVLTSPLMNRDITLEVYMSVYGKFEVRGWFFGEEDHFTRTVLPAMLSTLPVPDNTTIRTRGWLDALNDIAEGEPLAEPLSGYHNHQTFYTKSVVTREAEPLTRAALESFFAEVGRGLGKVPFGSYISLYGGRDSQINVPDVGDAAFGLRDSLWVFQNIGSSANMLPPFSPDIKAYVNGLNAALTDAQPGGEFLAYPNYLDPELSPAEAHRLYFGKETYEKLLGLKEKVDPKKVFWNPQAVGN
ncbi:hypothetical protein HBI13_141290 [Parastagonospora nodorum]|nr:hypothetical protein HBI10_175760 [Parastagonospora nodorum]KAH4017534.1 hypothetical protein HBI13_141290 [Parastagonospora nodorum]KAH5016677.1 hypothetical protein HBI75_180590 [Parastagonospora nodorum]